MHSYRQKLITFEGKGEGGITIFDALLAAAPCSLCSLVCVVMNSTYE